MKSWLIQNPRSFWGIYLYQDSDNYKVISDGKWYSHYGSKKGAHHICIDIEQVDSLPTYLWISSQEPKSFLIVSERYDSHGLICANKRTEEK